MNSTKLVKSVGGVEEQPFAKTSRISKNGNGVCFLEPEQLFSIYLIITCSCIWVGVSLTLPSVQSHCGVRELETLGAPGRQVGAPNLCSRPHPERRWETPSSRSHPHPTVMCPHSARPGCPWILKPPHILPLHLPWPLSSWPAIFKGVVCTGFLHRPAHCLPALSPLTCSVVWQTGHFPSYQTFIRL